MQSQRMGFSLIEVMVALVILTIGLIGIFNLHLLAKQSSYAAFQQTQAAYFALDMINRMRLNPSQLNGYAGSYNGSLSMPEKSCDININTDSGCTSAEVLAWDLFQWQFLFSGATEKLNDQSIGGLDSAIGCIEAASNGAVTIVMSWRGIRSVKDSASSAPAFAFAFACGDPDPRRRIYSISTVI